MENRSIGRQAAAFYDDALVWDNHACFPQVGAEPFFPLLERYRQSGVNVLGVNIGDSTVELPEMIRLAAALRDYIARNSDRFTLIRSTDDIAAAKAQGKLAILFNIEGAYAMGEQLSMIQFYYDIGVRWMAMVYNLHNRVGCGVHDNIDTGLTPFGRDVVAEMDRVGLIKCCSHTGYRTALDTFAVSTKPCIFSHSNALVLRDHPRNIPNELIDACAKTGGAICVNGVGIFLGENDISTATVIRHIDHIVQRVGADHVGIGLDFVFDQQGFDDSLRKTSHTWPAGYGYDPGIKFVPPEQLPEIAEELLTHGYKESDIRGILGENLLRVARDVWPA